MPVNIKLWFAMKTCNLLQRGGTQLAVVKLLEIEQLKSVTGKMGPAQQSVPDHL